MTASPRTFAVCMVPLTKNLQDAKAEYTLGDVKIHHLFYMDDLKVYGKDKAEIEILVATVQLVSRDIGIEFGIIKCGVVVPKRGRKGPDQLSELASGEKWWCVKNTEEASLREVGDSYVVDISEAEDAEEYKVISE